MEHICRVNKSAHHSLVRSHVRATILSFSPNNIPVLNHTLNLPPHRQKHQNQPVNNQHRPEDGQVEDLAPAAQESNANGARGGVPELELREAAHEGLEFLVALGG
jgi:hypothetical protein